METPFKGHFPLCHVHILEVFFFFFILYFMGTGRDDQMTKQASLDTEKKMRFFKRLLPDALY